MTGEENKALYRHFVEQVINNGKYDEIPELYTADYVDHSAPPGAPGGLDGVARRLHDVPRRLSRTSTSTSTTMVAEGDQRRHPGDRSAAPTPAVHGHARRRARHATWGSKGIFRVARRQDRRALGACPTSWPSSARSGRSRRRPILPPADTSDLDAAAGREPPADPTRSRRCSRATRRSSAGSTTTASSRGDIAACDEIVAADYVDHPPARFFDVPVTGPESPAGGRARLPRGLSRPDATRRAADRRGQQRRRAHRCGRGTHTGTFVGIPPTGKPVEVHRDQLLPGRRGRQDRRAIRVVRRARR